MKRNRLALAGCVAFALFGLLLVIAGPAENRVIGTMTILFFGVGALALLAPVLSRRGAGTVRVIEVGSERGFLFPISRLKQLVIVIAVLGMAGGSALLALLGNAVIGILGLVVFGGSR